MCEDFLGVLEPLGHFRVVGLQGSGNWVVAALALFVDVGYLLALAAQDDLGFVLEVHLGVSF